MEPNTRMDVTTLFRHVVRGHYGEVEKMLQEDSSRVNETEKTKYGFKTLLEAAVIRMNVRMVRILLYYGADPNVLTKDGNTPLHLAMITSERPDCQEPAIAIAMLLIRYGADMEITDDQQETPTMSYVMAGLYELTEILLHHGVNINTRDIIGRTALMWAAFHGSEREVALLIQHGADISIKGLDGLNAEQLAFERRDKGECFSDISVNLRDIRKLREARQLNKEKFEKFAMIHGEEEGQRSFVHLLNPDVVQSILEYAQENA